MKLSRNTLLTVLSSGAVAAIILACGSEGSTFDDKGQPPLFSDSGFDPDSSGSQADLYKDDPPPPWCGPDGAERPPEITGSLECPSDKNKPGCACEILGDKQPCWEGLRRHRNLGICKDGVATCIRKNETTNVWGPCEGQVLPEIDATGKAACSCFSIGEWKIANTSPCLWSENGTDYYAYSTVYDSANGTAGFCNPDQHAPPGTAPQGIWSTDTLKVDCAGTFTLCFRIRAGKFESPSKDDCILGETCVEAVYPKENVEQELPPLKTWAGKDAACAKKWEKDTAEDVSPGYGEMVVKGQTVRCDEIGNNVEGDYVFHRVKYCPRICRPSHPNYNPTHPECLDCQLKGSGSFE